MKAGHRGSRGKEERRPSGRKMDWQDKLQGNKKEALGLEKVEDSKIEK